MLRIGVVQFSAIEGDIQKNCSHIMKLTKKYVDSGIDLICFPELCISGYNFEKAKESVSEAEFFSRLAKEHHIAVMAGIHVIHETKHYNAACLWDDNGTLLGEYRKIHLWDKECEFFQGGEDLVVLPFKGWKIGLLICADMGFPEVSTPLHNMGADVIIYPSAWMEGWGDLFQLCARTRAAENQMYVIALNRASGDLEYCGLTSVVNPDGSIQRCIGTQEDCIKAVLHKDAITEARRQLPWQSMKLPNIYKKYKRYLFLESDDTGSRADEYE